MKVQAWVCCLHTADNSPSLCFPTAPECLIVHPGGLGSRLHSAPCLLEYTVAGARQKSRQQQSDAAVPPSSGVMAVCPLHSSPRLSELMQRSPLPTILGSPSRVGALTSTVGLLCLVLMGCSLLRWFRPSSCPNPPVLQTCSTCWLSRVCFWAPQATEPPQRTPPGHNSTVSTTPADGASGSSVLAGEAQWCHGCGRLVQEQGVDLCLLCAGLRAPDGCPTCC